MYDHLKHTRDVLLSSLKAVQIIEVNKMGKPEKRKFFIWKNPAVNSGNGTHREPRGLLKTSSLDQMELLNVISTTFQQNTTRKRVILRV